MGIIGFFDYECEILYNAGAVFNGNKLAAVVHKTLLPTYDVFDEARYFKPSKDINPVKVNVHGEEINIGVEICEDLWDGGYHVKVTDTLAAKGADLIINLSASPFYVGKKFARVELLREKSGKNRLPIFYVNMVGGQDELVFDGQSLAVDKTGNLIAVGKQFEEDIIIVDLNAKGRIAKKVGLPFCCKEQEMFNALVSGVRDYFRKT